MTGGDRHAPRPAPDDSRLSPIHSPYNYNDKIYALCYRNSRRPFDDREARVKFRCERDTLAEAVATAQRAVASRTGAMPVLSGLQAHASPATRSSSSAPTSSSRSGCGSRPTSEGDGSAVRPGPPVLGDRAQARGRHVSRRARRRRRPDRGGSVRDRRCARLSAAEFPRLPEAERGRRAGRRRPRSPRRCARWCRPRRVTTPARSSPACCSPRRPDGLRLVATDSYRLGAARPRRA